MTLSGSESLPGHCPWTPSRCSLASLTPLAIIIHNYFPPLKLGWLQPWLQLMYMQSGFQVLKYHCLVQVNEMTRYQVLREETSINLTTLVNWYIKIRGGRREVK